MYACTMVAPRDRYHPVWLFLFSASLCKPVGEVVFPDPFLVFQPQNTESMSGRLPGGGRHMSMACWCLDIIVLVLGLIVMLCCYGTLNRVHQDGNRKRNNLGLEDSPVAFLANLAP